jgi:alpha-methylacyl-CoA racemase
MDALAGIRVLEFEGIGPAPYAGMLLADMGADVVRVARPGAARGPLIEDVGGAVLHRNRRALVLDLKREPDRDTARRLAGAADALVEGLRPGAMERLGLGPDPLMAANPRLVYARITGWGQDGPLAPRAGHDINYIALAGVLGAMGPGGAPPVPPLNLVGDFGGGGLWAAFGILAALIERGRTGQGRVIDAAMLDGAASQMAMIHAWAASGAWRRERGANLLDGGAPFYRCYECACGGYVAVGAIEPPFFAVLMEGLGLDAAQWDQADRARWPALADAIAARFATDRRDAWAARFEGTDACVSPVLTPWEAPGHPHNAARGTFANEPAQPAAGPRLGAGAPEEPRPETEASAEAVLAAWEGR